MVFTTNASTNNGIVDRTLQIRGVKNVDPYALKALNLVVDDIKQAYQCPADFKTTIIRQVKSAQLGSLSERLNLKGFDDITRLLLSTPEIYAVLIYAALQDNVQANDLDGLYHSIVWNVEDKPRRLFLARLITQVLNAKRIQVKRTHLQWQKLDELTLQSGIPIHNGQVESAVEKVLSILYREGEIPYYVDLYVDRGELGTKASPAVRQGMVDYLVKLGLKIKPEAFQNQLYDEYFALAYSEALKRSATADDPIDMARIKGGEVSWDFTVDTFESTEEQGVIPANILAAGALDYLFYVGECMYVFNVANALVLRWAKGILDIPDGQAAAQLYRFHKLRVERSTPEERAMLYKRVLNKGNGQLLSNMVVNEAFPAYWHQLMSEATEYIRKREGSPWKENQVSRAPIYQATKNLQYNLTEYMTGMSHLQVTEDYAHLQEAMDLLRSKDILEHFGGRRRSVWNVVERVAKEDFGIAIPTAAVRTLAVEGNKVFQWIANFNAGMVQEDEFNTFLRAAESWIIAQSGLESNQPMFDSSDAPRLNGGSSSNGNARDEDDFADWEV
jgi:hypothetical protein